MKRAKQNKSH